MALNPNHPNLIIYRHPTLTLDLNSASATETPNFTFPPPREQAPTNPIIILQTINPFSTCLHVKAWLLEQHDDPDYSAPGILRMDYLELEKIDRSQEGTLIVAPDAGEFHPAKAVKAGGIRGQGQRHADADGGNFKVSILAILVKGDQRVRWFYSLFPISSLLARLDEHNLVSNPQCLEPRSASPKDRERYGKIFTFLREAFGQAVRVEESADFVAAQQISDFCVSILDPDNAVGRLESESWLGQNTPKAEEYLLATTAAPSGHAAQQQARDLAELESIEPSDDRYLLHLHPAERELATMARLRCAEYIFVKRNFFRAFWEEIYRSGKVGADALGDGGERGVIGRRGDGHGQGASGEGRQDTPVPVGISVTNTPTSTPGPASSTKNSTPAPPLSAATPASNTNTNTPQSAQRPATRARASRAHAGFDKAKRARVRTERAHQVWLENEYKLKNNQARTLVIGWRVLGFLDEERYARWVREGWGPDAEEGEEEVDGKRGSWSAGGR